MIDPLCALAMAHLSCNNNTPKGTKCLWECTSTTLAPLTTHTQEVWGVEKLPDVLVVDLEAAGLEELHYGRHRDEADQAQRLLLPEFSTSMSRLDPRSCWRQLPYAIKNQLGIRIQSPPKAPYNRTFPYMEAISFLMA